MSKCTCDCAERLEALSTAFEYYSKRGTQQDYKACIELINPPSPAATPPDQEQGDSTDMQPIDELELVARVGELEKALDTILMAPLRRKPTRGNGSGG